MERSGLSMIVMKTFRLKVKIQKVLGNIARKRHVLVVCRDTAGKFLLGHKPHFYPKGIYRFIGGGVGKDEKPKQAAVRELKEELGVSVREEKLTSLAKVIVEAETKDQSYTFTTYLYFLQLGLLEIKPGGEIVGVARLTLKDLVGLAGRFEDLDENLWFKSEDGYSHSWGDYGKVYGPIHRIAYEELRRKNFPGGKFKLVCFDVDGTLVEGVSWRFLTEGLKCSLKILQDLFSQAWNKKISFQKAERMLTRMYQNSGKATQKEIEKIFSKVNPRQEAYELIHYLREKGYQVCLVSGAIDIYVEKIAQKLGVDWFLATTTLEFDTSGNLRRIDYNPNQSEAKMRYLNELISKLGVDIKEVTFIGDSDNDIEAFKATGRGIAVYTTSEELKRAAWKVVNSLIEIKEIL
jgi:HAD superfamily phosphoserine phosphatase-like hydrolase